ncbi:MAG: formyltetrahydrofolate deformylase [Planctomycetaceae bacterium]|nr:formyltetrahydrofolate deformylase [Planctomycetaceae bacterium]
MQVTITAVGPDSTGLADPIIHHLTGAGANIHEIQMYDHDAERLFAMLLRAEWPETADSLDALRERMAEIGRMKDLSVRVWVRPQEGRLPRIAICTTWRPEPAKILLDAIAEGTLNAVPALMTGNRPACRKLAEQHDVHWELTGDERGVPDNERMLELFDRHEVDYIILARYMRVLPASLCWKYAGGRIINLHHGLLPPFPGFRPYEDAYARRMLTYGATVHFIVPELDAGDQTIHQSTFTVLPGTSLEDIKRQGERSHEPTCLLEGVRRVIDGDVELHFHRVVNPRARSSS